MMMFLGGIPGVARCCAQGQRIGGWRSIYSHRQYKFRCRPGLEPGPITTGRHLGVRRSHSLRQYTGLWLWVPARAHFVRLAGTTAIYAEAVVTPPSTTIVCPVMKVEASEA